MASSPATTVRTGSTGASSHPVFRSSAVARMARMPVSTLRIWEQRYQAVRPTTAPSGHRMYSSADVERVVLLRRLTEQGLAIGSLASLNNEQLQKLALVPVPGEALPRSQMALRSAPLRLVVVGQAMARRLQRLSAAHHRAGPLQVVGVFSSLSEAADAGAGRPAPEVDLLLWQVPGLQAAAPLELQAAQAAWHAARTAVCYRFAGASARDALARIGVAVAREPADDESLGAWLASLAPPRAESEEEAAADASGSDARAWALRVLELTTSAVPARRFDDATLVEFASQPSAVACECPRHLAELLIQISSFEAYTAECGHRSRADAQLHAELKRVAGVARILFESALERVAAAEGLTLP